MQVDPTIIVAILVTIQVAYQAWTKYVVEKRKQSVDSTLSMAGAMDERVRLILDRQDREIQSLKAKVEHLELVEQSYIRLTAWLIAQQIHEWPGEDGD